MYRKPFFRSLPLLVLISALILSGCAPFFEIASKSGTAPTPVVGFVPAGTDNPDIFVDPAAFQGALLQALVARDTTKLQMWMTEPFLTGAWRAGLSDTAPAEAIKALYAEQLGAGKSLVLVKGADLRTLLGGKDPLSIPRGEAGITDAFLVSGWGQDGRDEAVLFIARQPDNSLKWRGWLRIKGGFSGARLGGIQPYQNDAFGFSVFLPKGYEASQPNASEAMFVGPGQGHPDDNRVGVFVMLEPANGRTAEQVATQFSEETKAQMGAGYTGAAVTVMGIDGEPAYSLNQLPGQDWNRRLFMVHNDLLYTLMFVPDNPQASAYGQMEDAYAEIVNTFQFTK